MEWGWAREGRHGAHLEVFRELNDVLGRERDGGDSGGVQHRTRALAGLQIADPFGLGCGRVLIGSTSMRGPTWPSWRTCPSSTA